MISKEDAVVIVQKKLDDIAPIGDPWRIVKEKTVEKPFGWIFFYNTVRFQDTGNPIFKLAGNGPVFVNKFTGDVRMYGSLPRFEDVLSQYENELLCHKK